ncbi:MAG TPA: glycine cleavage system aminomethyltransferase GcvT [Propionibacteriaceae bacterium]|nr:glycine cleavage system aminomethyltransferase GcvT [Propionibacteriaceae bacterium]
MRSPLHARHVAAGAKFAAFSGWTMPVEYAGGGVLAEHQAVRTAVGLFDVSHLGKASVVGPGAAEHVNRCLTNDLTKIAPGQAQYTLLCTSEGGVVDDMIAYLRSPEEVFLVPNAANCARVVATLAAAAPAGVRVIDQHQQRAILAVQGSRSDDVLNAAGLPIGHAYMSFATGVVRGAGLDGVDVTVCRTGYTGERGYELVAPDAAAAAVWDAVVSAGESYGLRLAGLGARDTLRTEMGYPLHGQDISESVTPVQAGLGWAVGWAKESFIGDRALRAEKASGPALRLRGLRAAGRGIPRPGMAVLDASGHQIGTVTSGTFSPTVRTGIGLAMIDASYGDHDPVAVDIRGRREMFTITRPPFVHPPVPAGRD